MKWLNILFCDTDKGKNYNIDKIISNSDFPECTIFITSDREKAAEIIESDQLLSVMIIGYDLNKIGDAIEAINFIKKYHNIPAIFLDYAFHGGILKENYAKELVYRSEIYNGLTQAINKIIKDNIIT